MHEYKGSKIIVRFDTAVCTHSGMCVKGLPGVFDVNKKPWVNVEGAGVEEIEAQVKRCPSGALSCEKGT